MRRATFITLVAVGILVLGARLLVSDRLPSENPPGTEIQFVEYGPFHRLSTSNSPLSPMQSAIDRVSEAAVQGQWTEAARAARELEQDWRGLIVRGAANLQAEQDMEAAMENLYLNVWSQDEQGVLAAAQKLTALLGQLAE